MSAGLAAVGKETAAQILAIIYILGGERESFTHNDKLKADIEYIQKQYGFMGSETPNMYVAQRVRHYANDLNQCGESYPEWATRLMLENYGIKL